jgi:hypothetical protein
MLNNSYRQLVPGEMIMERPYLILVNGILAKRRMTKAFALRDIAELQAKGMNAVLAYDITGGK